MSCPTGGRASLGLAAGDIGGIGAGFGSPQSVPEASTTAASAGTRTSLKTGGGSSSQDGAAAAGGATGGAAAGSGKLPAGIASAGEDTAAGRRTRASIRTTSRLNAAYAIEMMRAEGAADMRHIMDSLVEQQPGEQVGLSHASSLLPSPMCPMLAVCRRPAMRLHIMDSLMEQQPEVQVGSGCPSQCLSSALDVITFTAVRRGL